MDATGRRALTERELAERIRETGLRVTRPRLLVLELLRELGGHRSAEEVIAILRDRGSTLPRASVYNVLNDLVSRGLVMVADAGPGRALYEVAMHWHHHFVCRDCGAIVDVPCAVGEKPCLDPGIPGITADEAQIIFRGACPFGSGEEPKVARPPECSNSPGPAPHATA